MKSLFKFTVLIYILSLSLAVSAADTNLALNKVATQSSTGTWGGITAIASKAVDGNTNGDFYGASVTHTLNNSPHEWWHVDLGDVYNISKIEIYNRTDSCCVNRLRNVHVMVSDTPFTQGTTLGALNNALALADWKGQVGSNPGNKIDFDAINTTGRYVLIQKSGNNNDTGYLHMAEVEVYGSEVGNTLDIAQKPLFLTNTVPPNLLFVIDDSGSMKWSHMPDSIVGVCNSSSSQTNRARGRSSDYNKLYYNPTSTYLPPRQADGTRLPNASFTSAWDDGYQQTGNVDLRTQFRATWRFPWAWSGSTEAYCGGTGAADYYTYDPDCGNLESNSCYNRTQVPNEQRQNFANWYSYYRTRTLVARAGIGDAFNSLPSDFRLGWGLINQGSTTVDGSSQTTVTQGVRPFQGDHKNSFYNWLQNSPDTGSTPLRTALQGAGNYFTNTTSRGPYSTLPGSTDGELVSCRQNFTILMSDGYYNGGSPGVGNVDGDMDHPFDDTFSNTLADVAAYYWETDLASGLDDNVPTSERNPQNQQHMVTYTVGLGVTGNIDPDTAFAAIDSGTPIAWPNPTSSDENKIDDMLHAAVNGRGGFFSASDPQTFASELESVLLDIVAQAAASTTSVASSTFFPTASTLLYQSSFDSNSWTGNITAYKPVLSGGSLSITKAWDAAAELPTNRKIYSYSDASTPGAIEFSWGSGGLTASQKALLNDNEDILDYIRGEPIAGMRGRGSSVIGDIINSNPVFVHRDDFGYHRLGSGVSAAKTYQKFVFDKRDRKSLITVGANAGMLHGFDAETGKELFAYVPRSVINKLPLLTQEGYEHTFFVDGNTHVSDAVIDGNWKTILVGSLGAGGKSIFALDITDPDNFGVNNVLWEFDNPELGFSFAEPVIGRLKNGSWVVIVGNGYNSNSSTAQLLVIDLKTGNLLTSIDTQEGGAVANGLSSPTVLYGSEDGNSFVNYVYAGDLMGNLWKFDLNHSSPGDFEVANSGDPLFTATNAGQAQPITVRPSLKLHPQGGMMVMFGTGQYIATQDSADMSIQSLYGIRDTGSSVELGDLVSQEILFRGNFPGTTTPVTALSGNSVNYNSKDGWVLNLIYNSSPEGERLITNPQIWNNRLRVATLIPNDDPCSPGAKSWNMELDFLTGGRLTRSIYDLDKDGEVNDDDFIEVDGVKIPVSGKQYDRPPSLTTPLGDFYISDPSDEDEGVEKADSGVQRPAEGRLSWREVFDES